MTNRLRLPAAALFFAAPLAFAAPELPALGVDLSRTTVSGVSSGAYMAVQFGVAHSAIVTGVGVVAGGPYSCASEPADVAPLWNALTRCMNPSATWTDPPDAALLWSRARALAQDGRIDDVANIAHQRVYIFTGTLDRTVIARVAAQARDFYQRAGASRITYVDNVAAGHGMVTDREDDEPCGSTWAPFFNNCHFPLARTLLASFHDGLGPPSAHVTGTVLKFDQRAFAGAGSGMADDGFLFVPASCLRAACLVHVAFHSCFQDAARVGDHFYGRAGYNETADANGIVVLYPQVKRTTEPYNPNACWDYWGYSGADYYTRGAAQIAAVHAMLVRLALPRRSGPG